MLYPESTINKIKYDIEQSTYIEGLIKFKEEINKMIDKQIIKIEENQDLITQISHNGCTGHFYVEKGVKAEYIINGWLTNKELIEKVKCKRVNTKKYKKILEELIIKYNPDVVDAWK